MSAFVIGLLVKLIFVRFISFFSGLISLILLFCSSRLVKLVNSLIIKVKEPSPFSHTLDDDAQVISNEG